jgi:hypothetical protein
MEKKIRLFAIIKADSIRKAPLLLIDAFMLVLRRCTKNVIVFST